MLHVTHNRRPRPRDIGHLLHQAGVRFVADDTFQEGAALAYYAIFALPALIVLITRVVGSVFGPAAVTGALYREVRKVLGPSGAHDVQVMVEKASHDTGLTVAAVVGLVALLIAGTGLFVSLQETLNQIWGVRARPKRAWLKILIDRGRGLLLMMGVGVLLLLGVLAQTLLVGLGGWLDRVLPGAQVMWLHVANQVSSVLVGILLFGSIFKFLPDARIRWREIWVGALVTSVLFAVGKALIGAYLGRADLGSVYGAAGTVIVLLAWVFYSSQILFFGAIFTRCYAEEFGPGIQAAPHAVRVQVVEVSAEDVRIKHDPTASAEPTAVPDVAKEAVRVLTQEAAAAPKE
ncbi:MAG: YihY/virulence factor BrkB family protein [Hymenobacteraceae bacterium]|nr:YihY/virulence factor BrkB family protein [Hymenobacteraceae bacterium]